MLIKKLFIIFLFCLFFTPTLVLAETTTSSITDSIDSVIQIYEAAKPGKTTLERWTHDQVISTGAVGNNLLFGDTTEYLKGVKNSIVMSKPMPRFMSGGLIGASTNMIGILYKPSASGIQYIAQTWDNILGKPSYAQSPNGFGFQGLQFLLPLWKGFRNIVYVLSSIIFVAIGLMIILRVKISPQAVVTVQSAIPAVITTLILITFSYAIAGLIIDLSNLIGGVVLATIFNSQGKSLTGNLLEGGWGVSSTFTALLNPGFATLGQIIMNTAPGWSIFAISIQIGQVIGGMLVAGLFNGVPIFPITYTVGNIVGGFLGIIAGIFLPFIIGLIVGIWVIQLFFGLLTNYVTVIFKVITGPLEIAMGAFPNSKVGFGTWFMDVFANTMVFPIISIYFSILSLITYSVYNTTSSIWAPGPISTSFFATSVDNVTQNAILSSLIGLAGLALASKLPKLIPEYIFMIKSSSFGQAVGENVKGMYDNIVTRTALDLITHW